MGCPKARAGVKIVKKRIPRATQILTPSLLTTSGVVVGVALVMPTLVGHLYVGEAEELLSYN